VKGATAILLGLGTAGLLAGCGGNGSSDSSAAKSAPAVVRTTQVEVVHDRGGGAPFDAAAIYRRAAPGVVTVISTGLNDPQGTSGLGSGFVISGSGEIVTNAHVVTSGTGSSIQRARQVFVRFGDDNQVPARIIGYDPNGDVALLRVDPTGLTLRPLPLGSTRDLKVGDPVAAIGSPFGEEQSLSVGVVSATGRSIQSLTGFDIIGAIQTDAAINHGNSGGPLLNSAGDVLGINSQIESSSGEGSGVGFAVPVDTVKRSVAQLRKTGKVAYAYLGVRTLALYPQLAQRFHLPVDHGAYIDQVSANGPADKAGLHGAGSHRAVFQAQRFAPGGDIIAKVAGHPIRREDDLPRVLARFRPGDKVALEVWRGGSRRIVRVTLGERPGGTSPQP